MGSDTSEAYMSITPPTQLQSPHTTIHSNQPNSASPQFVGFRLANQNYIFRIESIQEIVMPSRVAKIPEVPAYVDGVSNLRGMIIPIVNLRSLFNLTSRPHDEETRIIVVNVGSRTIGCTVDSVLRVMRVPEETIQPAPDSVNGSGRRFIEGFTVWRMNFSFCLMPVNFLNLLILNRYIKRVFNLKKQITMIHPKPAGRTSLRTARDHEQRAAGRH